MGLSLIFIDFKTGSLAVKVSPGDKIKMHGEVQRYTINACDGRFIIASKPFNAKKTYIYTIIDLDANWQGPDNYLFGFKDLSYDNKKDCKKALKYLNSGELGISYRHGCEIKIERIDYE